jgi:hypothetical protein
MRIPSTCIIPCSACNLLLWNTHPEAIGQVRRQGPDAQAAMPGVNMIHTLHRYTPQNRAAQWRTPPTPGKCIKNPGLSGPGFLLY